MCCTTHQLSLQVTNVARFYCKRETQGRVIETGTSLCPPVAEASSPQEYPHEVPRTLPGYARSQATQRNAALELVGEASTGSDASSRI